MPRKSRADFPPLFSRRELLHLLFMVALLCVIVGYMDRVRDPRSVAWLYAAPKVETRIDDAGPPPEILPDQAARRTALAELREQPLTPIAADAPVASDAPATPAAALGNAVDAPPAGRPPEPLVALNDPRPLDPAPLGVVNPLNLQQIDECTQVNRELLEGVRDRTAQSADDAAAIFQMLCVASTLPPEKLRSAARRDVLFANLWNDPDAHRGKPIHVEGVLRQLTLYDGQQLKNPYSVPAFYEAWIFTQDQSDNPTKLLFTELPAGLAPGVKLAEYVRFNGFFLKIERYGDQGGNDRGAPVLVGAKLEWTPIQKGVGSDAVYLGLGLMAAMGVATFFLYRAGRQDEALAARLQETAGPAPDATPSFLLDDAAASAADAVGDADSTSSAAPGRETPAAEPS
ncbi:MAG: hypothetical protein ACRC1K_00490 [Planctomycetia bacterium]